MVRAVIEAILRSRPVRAGLAAEIPVVNVLLAKAHRVAGAVQDIVQPQGVRRRLIPWRRRRGGSSARLNEAPSQGAVSIRVVLDRPDAGGVIADGSRIVRGRGIGAGNAGPVR